MNHYFSRAKLVDRPQDMALLSALSQHGGAYRDHALVWRLFPGDEAPRDFVFRRDVGQLGNDVYYVVSRRPPQPQPGLFSLESKPYAPALSAGEWLRFDLRANPTITRRIEPQGPSRRHDVLMQAKFQYREAEPAQLLGAIHTAALAWLQSRVSSWGLELNGESVGTDAYTQHKLRHKQRRIEFSSLDYSGLARVIDPEKLAISLTQGVGHSRAFGCGLLLVRRAG